MPDDFGRSPEQNNGLHCHCFAEVRFFKWQRDEVSVSLRHKSGSYGGGSEVLIVQRRFSNVFVQEADVSPTIEAGSGEGGNNLPIVLESNQNHATAKETEVCTTLPASMGFGGGYVPMVVTNNECGNGPCINSPECGEDGRENISDYHGKSRNWGRTATDTNNVWGTQ